MDGAVHTVAETFSRRPRCGQNLHSRNASVSKRRLAHFATLGTTGTDVPIAVLTSKFFMC